MSTSQKRKFSEHYSHNVYKKKIKTKQFLHKEIASSQEKNIPFSENCTGKVVSTTCPTPSVSCFFKKTKRSPQKVFKDMTCVRDNKVFKNGNSKKKFNHNGISEITPGNVKDVHLSMNTACNRQKNWQNDTIYNEGILKCELFPSTHKWSDLNCSILPQKKFTVSNIVKDEGVASDEMFSSTVVENTCQYIDQCLLESSCIETETANKKNLGQICGSSLQKISLIKLQQPKMEYSVSPLSKILYPKNINYSHLIQDESMLQGNKNAKKKLFTLKSDSSTSNIKHSRLTDEYVPQKNQYFEKTQEFHSMYYTMFQNIRKSSFPSPIKDEINMEEYTDIANILNQYDVEKKSLLGKRKDFHSMYSTFSSNIPVPFLFPTEEGRNKTVEEKPGKYLPNCYKEHTEKSLNHLESQTVLKKMSSFENFIENFSHVNKNRNSITINCSDSVLPYENDNISFNRNGIIHSTSPLPETNDETLLEGSAKLFRNIDKLSLDHLGIQSKTKPLKNISKTVEELNIAESINSITSIESIPGKQSLDNLNKFTTKKILNPCTNRNSISKTKIRNKNDTTQRLNSEKSAKAESISCIFSTFGRDNTEFVCESTMKRNVKHQSSAHNYESISTELSNELYENAKSTQSETNFKIVSDKFKPEKYSNITSDIETSIYNIQKEEVNQKNYAIQQYQDSNFTKFSIDTDIDNQNNFEQKQFSPIKNSILYEVSDREVVNPFGDLNSNIFEDSNITSPILMTENVQHIGNSTTYNRKIKESTNMSKMLVRNKTALDEQDKQTETENCSNQYVPSDKQENMKLNNSRFNHSKSGIGGICNKMKFSLLNNDEICRSFSRLQNSVNNIVQHNLAASVHDKLKHSSNTQILATEDRIESSSNSGSKYFDFIITSPNISNTIPILNELEIDVVRKGTSKFSNFENSSETENIKEILQISEDNISKEKYTGVKKCNLIPDVKSESSSRSHCDETIKEIEMHNMRYVAHNETPCSTKSRDTVIYKNVHPLGIPHSFSEHEYELLKKASSPLLSDLECRSYLKSLINRPIPEKDTNSIEPSVSEAKHRDYDEQLSFIGLKEMENKTNIDKPLNNYADSQEKELNQFWDNISSQNDHFNYTEENSSQNIASVPNHDECCTEKRSFFTKNSNAVNENLSQGSETEILNHILSQNFTESDTLLSGVLKNMDNLSQKPMKQRNSLHNFNQNSNKLLELALMMYKQFKTNIILSNKEKVIFTQSIRNQIEVERNGSSRIYRLKENSSDELIILNINSNSNNSDCEIYDFSKITSNETDKKILQGLYEIYQNKTFLYKKEDDGLHFSRQNKISVIDKIEEIFEDVLEKLAANKSPELRVRRQNFEDCLIDKNMLMLKFVDNPRIIKIHYKNVLSQPKFCLIMYVLAKSLELLKNNTKLTKREIYYQIKSLVSDQGKINSAIKAVSCMLLVGPWDLNIIAHKGMVFGDLKIKLCSNEIINCNIPGTLIPNDIDDFVELISSAYFILVVEKESIYYKLLEEDLPNRLVKSFIMITGKGFPDLNTQIFLRKLWMVMSLPIFILTDADPHGVNIMITYRFGSLANAHISDQLSVPKAKWLGIFPSEITKFDAEKQPLTDYEKFVIKNILKTPYMTDNPRIEAELKIMLELGYKAGIEGIIKNDTFLSEFYFPMKFYNQDLI